MNFFGGRLFNGGFFGSISTIPLTPTPGFTFTAPAVDFSQSGPAVSFTRRGPAQAFGGRG